MVRDATKVLKVQLELEVKINDDHCSLKHPFMLPEITCYVYQTSQHVQQNLLRLALKSMITCFDEKF